MFAAMAQLPSERINKCSVFNCTGLYLRSSFYVIYKNQSKDLFNKIFVCVSVCLWTRAIQLELLSDLTWETLIVILKQVMTKCGKCSKIFTRNVRNFVGGKFLTKKVLQNDKFCTWNFRKLFNLEEIDWKFMSLKSPIFKNFGRQEWN